MSNAKTAKPAPSEASQEAAANLLALPIILTVTSFLIWWLGPVATADAFDPGWWQAVAIAVLLVFVVRPCVTRSKLVVRVRNPKPPTINVTTDNWYSKS